MNIQPKPSKPLLKWSLLFRRERQIFDMYQIFDSIKHYLPKEIIDHILSEFRKLGIPDVISDVSEGRAK